MSDQLPPGTTFYASSPPDPARGLPWGKILGCGGCVVLAVVGVVVAVSLFFVAGLKVFEEQVRAELWNQSVLVEHLGPLEELELEVWASMLEEGPDDFVFLARGEDGMGRLLLTCITVDGDSEEVVAGTLELSSGRSVDLFPAEGP